MITWRKTYHLEHERMQQRSIRPEQLKTVLDFGNDNGRGRIALTDAAIREAISSRRHETQILESLIGKNLTVVTSESDVITAFRSKTV